MSTKVAQTLINLTKSTIGIYENFANFIVFILDMSKFSKSKIEMSNQNFQIILIIQY